jgi:hypothetical protein
MEHARWKKSWSGGETLTTPLGHPTPNNARWGDVWTVVFRVVVGVVLKIGEVLFGRTNQQCWRMKHSHLHTGGVHAKQECCRHVLCVSFVPVS